MYNIGLVVGNVEDPFSNSICKGAMRAAELVGDNLFIFPVKYMNQSEEARHDPKQQFEYQYNFLLAYTQSHSLDMVILCLSSIAYRTPHEESLALLRTYLKVPVLLLASQEEGVSTIKYDNVSGLRAGIEYLVQERDCKHICMLAGSKDNSDAVERLQVYKEVLSQNHMPFEEHMVAYGDMSEKCEPEVEKLLLYNPNLDAIVCTNDAMAKTVYKVLNKYQFQIGKDVCVLGFDDIEDAALLEPPLATVRADASALGHRAVVEVHGILEEYHDKKLKQVPVRNLQIETAFINRESVSGRKQEKKLVTEEFRLEYQTKINRMIDANHRLNIITRDMLMVGNGSESNFSDFLNAFEIKGNTSCYLFMLENPVAFRPRNDFRIVENVFLPAYRLNNQVVEFSKNEMKIPLDELFNNDCFEKRAKNYMVIDIYSREKQYGIMVCDLSHKYFTYVENLCYQISMATKIIDLLSVQEQLLSEKEIMLQKLEQENLILDDISNKDELTGICNRRGFITKAKEILKDEKNCGKLATVMYADLNYLKLINDRFSHAEGNFAIQSCANALEYIAGSQGIVGRIGGDEFALFMLLPYSGDGEQMKSRLKQYMEHINQNISKPYEITMSVGVHEFIINKDCELKELIKKADERLYEDKAHKKPFVER